ncbi:MAG: hypothetical protein RL091_3175, partial [Verrucomicrobiota bacterium]
GGGWLRQPNTPRRYAPPLLLEGILRTVLPLSAF